MKSVYLDLHPVRVVPTYLAGRISPRLYLSPTSPLRYGEVPEPSLPGPRWVKVRTTLSGICGSDIAAVTMKGSTALYPFTPKRIFLGHEAVGEVIETGKNASRVRVGERIVVDSFYSCREKGIEPPCSMCAGGFNSVCENLDAPGLVGGLGIGFGDGAGGGWSERFVCHEEQCVKIPVNASWEEGLMLEMLAVAVRGVLRRPPGEGERALVIGAGTIGLSVLMALRALFPGVEVSVAARHPHQAEAARRLGAEEVIRGDLYEAAARITGARMLKAPLSAKPTVVGGFENVYDSVGSSESLDDAVRLARSGGRVVLLGAAYEARIDWTFVWFKELTIFGALAYSTENMEGKKQRTFEVARKLLEEGKVDLKGLVTHTFPLKDYKKALRAAMDKGSGERPIKVALAPGE